MISVNEGAIRINYPPFVVRGHSQIFTKITVSHVNIKVIFPQLLQSPLSVECLEKGGFIMQFRCQRDMEETVNEKSQI